MVLALVRLVSIIISVPLRQVRIAMMAMVQEMLQKISVLLVGRCLLLYILMNIRIYIQLIILMLLPLSKLFLLLCRAASVARRPVRARTAGSGLLLGTMTTACIASTWIQALSTPWPPTIATTDSR